MSLFRRQKPDLEPDVVIDLRDEVLARENAEERSRREWAESADLVRYDDDFAAIAADRRRDSVVPRGE